MPAKKSIPPKKNLATKSSTAVSDDENVFFKDHVINFLDFPREIRDKVYDHALIKRLTPSSSRIYKKLLIDEKMDEHERKTMVDMLERACRVGGHVKEGPIKDYINLLHTSKKINSEATAVMYKNNTFHVDVCGTRGITRIGVPKMHIHLLQHVYMRITNQRSLGDPLLRIDSERIACNLTGRFCNMILTSNINLKSLEVHYLTLYAGAVEEVRGIIDDTADSSLHPPNMTGAVIMDVYGKQGIVDKDSVAKSWIWKYQTCLEPLKTLTGRVHQFSIKGDISQAYKDELIAQIKPVIDVDKVDIAKRKAQIAEHGFKLRKNVPLNITEAAEMMMDDADIDKYMPDSSKEEKEKAKDLGKKLLPLLMFADAHGVSPSELVASGSYEWPDLD